MNEIFSEAYWMNQRDLKVFIPIVAGLLGFLIFWFTQQSQLLKQKLRNKYQPEKAEANFILYTRYLGGVSMGVFPAVVYLIFVHNSTFSDFGIIWTKEATLPVILCSLALMCIIIPLVYKNARKSQNLILYPQIRTKYWSKKLKRNNFFSWAIYLLGYEIFFRGVLLFPLVEVLGIWPAIAVNIGLYSATHIPKGLTETIGAIPLSIILCLICIYTGNLWPAFFIHISIAWTNTWVSWKHNPEMKSLKYS